MCLLSLGATGWGIVAGESIEQRLETIRGVTRSIQNAGRRAVNRAVIEDRSRQLEEQKRQSDEAADVALQVHGGMGYAKEYHIERLWREVRLYRIAPVSQEMVLNYLGEHVLGLPRSY